MTAGATIVSVDPQKTEVHITYFHENALHTVAAKFAVIATPKLITSRIVSGLSDAQTDAMRSFRYCPYLVINMIYDKPVYNRAYDSWCPGNTFCDVVVADWVLQKQPDYKQKNNILTFYTPVSELHRDKLLQVPGCQKIAQNVLRDFQKLLPEFSPEPIEESHKAEIRALLAPLTSSLHASRNWEIAVTDELSGLFSRRYFETA